MKLSWKQSVHNRAIHELLDRHYAIPESTKAQIRLAYERGHLVPSASWTKHIERLMLAESAASAPLIKSASRLLAEPRPDTGLRNPSTGATITPETALDSPLVKVADKMNDFLMNPQARPDLQTPEAQQFLQRLKNKYHTERTDPLMPWLTREWKKGRLFEHPTPERWQGYYYRAPDGVGADLDFRPNYALTGEALDHWADWYHSNHPTRQGVDIMGMNTQDMHEKINAWDEDMKTQMGSAAENMGEVVHRWPDAWTIQNLREPYHLKDEGDAMGHCVGGYGDMVKNGTSAIYSLRDHDNEPHATMEIKPQFGRCSNCSEVEQAPLGQCNSCNGRRNPIPDGGLMQQIQGKANEVPKPEYQKRIAEWMGTFVDEDGDRRPTWGSQNVSCFEEVEDPDFFYDGNPGDYGLEDPERDIDWNSILEDTHDPRYESGNYSRNRQGEELIVERAFEWNEGPQLREALKQWYDEAYEDFLENLGRVPELVAEENGFPRYEDSDEYTGDNDPKLNSNRNRYYEQVEAEIAKQKWPEDGRYEFYNQIIALLNFEERKPRESKVEGHNHFSTGQPCQCTFTRHLVDTPRMRVATDYWQAWEPTKTAPADLDGIDPNEMTFFPEEWTPEMDQPGGETPPKFLTADEQRALIQSELQRAYQGTILRYPKFPNVPSPEMTNESVTLLERRLKRQGLAPDITDQVVTEFRQELQSYLDRGRSDLTPPQEWTARVAARCVPDQLWEW